MKATQEAISCSKLLIKTRDEFIILHCICLTSAKATEQRQLTTIVPLSLLLTMNKFSATFSRFIGAFVDKFETYFSDGPFLILTEATACGSYS